MQQAKVQLSAGLGLAHKLGVTLYPFERAVLSVGLFEQHMSYNIDMARCDRSAFDIK